MIAAVAPFSLALAAAGTANAATPGPAVPSAQHATGRSDSLEPLVNLLAQRLKTADSVSTAKYGTPSPVDDPAREKTELDSAAAMATKQGLDPNATRKIFSDQIQANKVVQYGLYSRWTALPNEIPKIKADLTKLRTQLDTITDDLIRDLAATKTARSASGCKSDLQSTERSVSRANHFDALHVQAFNRALVSVCT
ncbi:gamma subclass chorismate mutase AroQ [Pseudonocardia sp. CA-142604]|uniref:gamma subclass chorismate mutase AroQ n=1 Tax=Pseudonocardia sp. CA-142604 TaxID=3240024 RepID=UPI003D8D78E0